MGKARHHLLFKFKHGHSVFTIPAAKQSGADRIKSKRIDSTSVVPTVLTVLAGNMVETENMVATAVTGRMVEATENTEHMEGTDHRVFVGVFRSFS